MQFVKATLSAVESTEEIWRLEGTGTQVSPLDLPNPNLTQPHNQLLQYLFACKLNNLSGHAVKLDPPRNIEV